MELQRIVERYDEAIDYVDANVQTAGANLTRTGEVYQVGFKSMNEEPAVQEIDEACEDLHPGERQAPALKVRYPGLRSSAL